jgi:hypothetical protein
MRSALAVLFALFAAAASAQDLINADRPGIADGSQTVGARVFQAELGGERDRFDHAREWSTPLLLRYGAGDYNCLHQDLYGALAFPLQVAILLSEPGRDFAGGEFVLTEQRPRMQSRAEVVPLRQGEGVVFAVHHRPVQGTRGTYRVMLRHGVSRIRAGERFTLGVIFHDAR